MLRVIVNASSAGAKSYYSNGLSKDDYYTKGQEQEIIGNWGGKGAIVKNKVELLKHQMPFLQGSS